LSTLVTDSLKSNHQARKTTFIYLAVSVFCILFDKIYALFGHGVSSASMSLMFLYPLLGGFLPFSLLWFVVSQADQIYRYRILYNSYNSGLATLTIGSLLYGIFEIAGTNSPYLLAFTIGGWIMVAAGALGYCFKLLQRNFKNVRIELHN